MSLKRNTLYNLFGSLAPMVVSIVTVPIFLQLIGHARYGVLTLVWLFLGYFGLFDPGVARAAEFHIARLHGQEHDKERESVFWTAILINLGFGTLGGLVAFVIARPIFNSYFHMPATMREEVLSSLPWLAAAIPVSLITGMLGGAMQARERFAEYNLISLLGSVISQLAPLAVAYWHGPDLRWLIPTVLISRTVGAIPMCTFLIRALPLGVGGGFDRSKVRTLFVYGGWITVTNLLNPILTTADRLVIGSVLNAESVAFYTVPFNLVSRVSVVPGALAQSVFPKLSRGAREDSARLAFEAVTGLAAVMTVICTVGIALVPGFLHVWLRHNFAPQEVPIAIILLIGIWVNSLAFIPYSHLQAIEQPEVIAKFHAYELLPFLGVLWVGLHYFGLVGAAWAWTLRVSVDAILLFAVGGRIPGWRRILPGGALVLLAAVFAPQTWRSLNVVFESIIVVAALVWSWNVNPRIRTMLLSRFAVKQVSEAA